MAGVNFMDTGVRSGILWAPTLAVRDRAAIIFSAYAVSSAPTPLPACIIPTKLISNAAKSCAADTRVERRLPSAPRPPSPSHFYGTVVVTAISCRSQGKVFLKGFPVSFESSELNHRSAGALTFDAAQATLVRFENRALPRPVPIVITPQCATSCMNGNSLKP